MFLFNFYHGKFVNRFNFGFILLSILLSLLLWDATDHFENVISRVERALEVVDKVTGRGSVECLLHSQELVAWEEVLESRQHGVDCPCNSTYLGIYLLLLCLRWVTFDFCTNLNGDDRWVVLRRFTIWILLCSWLLSSSLKVHPDFRRIWYLNATHWS